MSWGGLFDRARGFDVAEASIRATRFEVREGQAESTSNADSVPDSSEGKSPADDETVRVVADADVLVADLLVGGASRDALNHVRRHSWVELVASDGLLVEARAVVADLATPELADDWLDRAGRERVRVEQPSGDHPALASAYQGNARHLLTEDERLTATATNLSIQSHMSVSVRTPDAFASLFDPAPLYESLFEKSYPGPDRDPRA